MRNLIEGNGKAVVSCKAKGKGGRSLHKCSGKGKTEEGMSCKERKACAKGKEMLKEDANAKGK